MGKVLWGVMLAAVLTITGCGGGSKDGVGPQSRTTIVGTYAAKNTTFVFSADGKVTSKGTPVYPVEKTTSYQIADGKVSFQFQDGYPMTLSINDDDTLSHDIGGRSVYKKVN